MTKAKELSLATPEYRQFIEELKGRVLSARVAAARAVNRDLILLYWDIGRAIVEKQQVQGWGDSVVEMIAADLRSAFPQITGFSPRNVWDMRRLYAVYTAPEMLAQAQLEMQRPILRQAVAEFDKDPKQLQVTAKPTTVQTIKFLQQLVAEIPWGQNLLILNKLTDQAAHMYYLRATARFGWSRNVLLNQIKAGAYERAITEKKTHNFPLALPQYLAEQADEALKSSYNLEFLGIRREVKERKLEDRLIERLRDFILELGYGFCFVGRQHRMTTPPSASSPARRKMMWKSNTLLKPNKIRSAWPNINCSRNYRLK